MARLLVAAGVQRTTPLQGEQEGHFAKWDQVPWGTGNQRHLPEAVTTGCSEIEVDQQKGSWN